MHSVEDRELPAGSLRDARLRLELGALDVRLTRAEGGARAAVALAAAYRGEREIVLGFGGVRAVRSSALTRLLGEARALVEPWAGEARLELRSLRRPVRRELLLWCEARDDLAVATAARRALTVVPLRRPPRAVESRLGTNRRRMLQLAARDGERCVWCATPLTYRSRDATVDHVRCRSHGGSDSLDNLVLACARCNHRRANRPAELWLQLCVASGLAVDERAVTAAIRRARASGRRGRPAAAREAA